MSNPTLAFKITNVTNSVRRLVALDGIDAIQISVWDEQHELIHSDRFPVAGMPDQYISNKVFSVMQEAQRQALYRRPATPVSYVLTEGYTDRGAWFVDGDTVTV